jgi:hypothetical protein
MARGDHLFYYRAGTVYSHHGIDCGDGSVIHFESSVWQKLGSMAQPESSLRAPRVVRARHDQFALGADVLVRTYEAFHDPEQVILRAESRLGCTDYDLWGNNCEHFAVWCKTGLAHSTQVAALEQAREAFWQASPASLLMLRLARGLPGHWRGVAYTGAAAMAGTACVATYLRHRHDHQLRRLS